MNSMSHPSTSPIGSAHLTAFKSSSGSHSQPLSDDSGTSVSLADSNTVVIGETMTIKGKLSASAAVIVRGKVMGSISAEGCRLTVSLGGRVLASATAREILVEGAVEGGLKASDWVEISSGGSMIGDIAACRIKIADGAFLHGHIALHQADSTPDENWAETAVC